MTLWTVGHSRLAAATFVALLSAHRIERVVDVRRRPVSRRYPHFTGDALARLLHASQIDYRHAPELGGRREPKPDSVNTGWRDPGLRGYADYMETTAFLAALERLIDAAAGARTAAMCAEADWRNCHRGLIADALRLRGVEVRHIRNAVSSEPHPFTEAARVANGRLSYTVRPPSQTSLDF